MKRIFFGIFAAVILCLSMTSCKEAPYSQTAAIPKARMLASPSPVEELFVRKSVIDSIDPYIIPYDHLTVFDADDEKYFRALIDGVLTLATDVSLSDDLSKNVSVINAVKKNPYWAFVKSCTFSDDGKSVRLVYHDYYENDAPNVIKFLEDEFLSIINSSVFEEMNELDKTLALYNSIGVRITYDFDWVDTYDQNRDKYLFHGISAYDALTRNMGACHTYAQLLEFSLRQVGVECVMLDGVSRHNSDENHSWIYVRLGDEYYHIDLTWDSDHKSDLVGLRYFGLSDDERYESGIITYTDSVVSGYMQGSGEHRFDALHKVYKFEWAGLHRWKVYTLENKTFVFNTNTEK